MPHKQCDGCRVFWCGSLHIGVVQRGRNALGEPQVLGAILAAGMPSLIVWCEAKTHRHHRLGLRKPLATVLHNGTLHSVKRQGDHDQLGAVQQDAPHKQSGAKNRCPCQKVSP